MLASLSRRHAFQTRVVIGVRFGTLGGIWYPTFRTVKTSIKKEDERKRSLEVRNLKIWKVTNAKCLPVKNIAAANVTNARVWRTNCKVRYWRFGCFRLFVYGFVPKNKSITIYFPMSLPSFPPSLLPSHSLSH
jgi:hypothetical protein